MSFQTYRIIKMIVVVIIAASVSSAVAAGIPWVPVPAAAIGAAILFVLRRRVKEVVIDERTWRIAERAGFFAYRLGAVLLALLAATFLALARSGNDSLGQAGLILAYAAAGLVAINYFSYLYYSKKLGGGE